MTDRVYSPAEIQDLTDRVFLLRKNLEEGKIHFAAHLVDSFRSSYEAIRLTPDGLVDPSTVNGSIRAATLALREFKYRQEAKDAISLADIQDKYFTILDNQFGKFYEAMVKAGGNPEQAAHFFCRNEAQVKQVIAKGPELISDMRSFWNAVCDSGTFHLQDSKQLKVTFSGDLFPGHWQNVVSTAGLYVDTIILPCPITRLSTLFMLTPNKFMVERLFKHVLTAMTYRSLATSGLSPPIVLILPGSDEVNTDERFSLIDRASPLILNHAKYLFGRDFESLPDLNEFCTAMPTIDNLTKELQGHDRLLFDTDWPQGPREQLTEMLKSSNPIPYGLDSTNAGHHVFASCMGRMAQALDAREKAFEFGGTPMITAPTSWEYFTWMLQYDADTAPDNIENRESMHVVRALTGTENSSLEWFGNVPPETILEIRKNGHEQEIRSILNRGIGSLVKINPQNYNRTATQLVQNLDSAFQDHQKAIKDAKNKMLKFYGTDVASCVAVGAIAVTAAITASPALGAISGFLGIAGAPNLKDIKSKHKDLAEVERQQRSSPTGILFRHIK